MKKTVYNVSRRFARDFDHDLVDTVWVSIYEPGDGSTKVQNTLLERVPNLQTSFFDATPPSYDMGRFTMQPATAEDIFPLVDFLVEHQEKDVVVNCAFGVSRSGAVAQFCQDVLGYNWNPQCKNQASPNMHILRLMTKYYEEKYENRCPQLEAFYQTYGATTVAQKIANMERELGKSNMYATNQVTPMTDEQRLPFYEHEWKVAHGLLKPIYA